MDATAVFKGGPAATRGMTIGLLGGSFDPPHQGHVHITQVALRRLGLDQAWWLVSPGNPLKMRGPADLAQRMAACRRIVDHPRIAVSDIETRLGTRYTADTLAGLVRFYPGVRFVWLMGADNLATFHLWEHWVWIMRNVPIAAFARPGAQISAGLAPAARRFARYRLPQAEARALPLSRPPAWSLLTGPMSPHSSAAIRARGDWS